MLKTPVPEMHGLLCTFLNLLYFMREELRLIYHVDTAVACQDKRDLNPFSPGFFASLPHIFLC